MRFEPPRWLAPAATAAAVVALVAWSAWRRWAFLTESPHPLGIDGYFYAVQLRSLLETGHLAYPVSPVGLWLLAPFAALTDPIVGAKLGASVLGALVAVPAYFVGKRLGGTRATGLFAAAIATPSAGSFYLSIEFVKNGIGITVAVTYLWLLLRALEQPRAGRVVAAAAALLAAIGTHKMAAGLAILVTVPAIAVEVHARRADWRRLALAAAATAAALIGVLAALAVLAPGRVLGVRELDLAHALFTADADWQVPALVGRSRNLWIGHEPALAGVIGLLALGFAAVRPRLPASRRNDAVRPAARAVAVSLAALSVLIALPWLDVHDPQGLGFRLRVAAFAPLALVGAALIGDLVAGSTRDLRVTGVIAFAAVWAVAQPARRDEGVVRAHPAMVASLVELSREMPSLPDDAVLICPERHILFMAAWYARADVRLRPERVPAARRWRLMPLAFIGKGSPLDELLVRARTQPAPPRGLHPRAANGLVLVPEPTWQWVLDQLPEPARTRFRNWRTI